jgi:hypothetical protein
MTQTPEDRRKRIPIKRSTGMAGFGPAPKHRAQAIMRRGKDALSLAQAAQLSEVSKQLQDRPGVEAAIRQQAALSLVLVNIVATYVETTAADGVPVDEIPVLRALPAFINTSSRLLKQLRAMLPNVADEQLAELERIREVVGVSTTGQNRPQAPKNDDRASDMPEADDNE